MVIKMGAMLFTAFTAMEIVLTVINCKKFSKSMSRIRNTAVCSAIEFAAMLLVILLPVTDQKLRFIGCLVVFGLRLKFTSLSLLVSFIKYKGFGIEERRTSDVGAVLSCAANIVLIFCFVFPTVVFPGFKEIETTEEGKAVMYQLLDESNENSDKAFADLNTSIFEYIVE